MPVERTPPRERSIPLSTAQTTNSSQCSTYSDKTEIEIRETMAKIRESTIPLSWSDQCKTPIALTANHHHVENPVTKTTLAPYNYPQETAVTSCTTATGTHYSIITTTATALSSTTTTTSSTSAKPTHAPSTPIQTATRSAECSAPTTLIASSSTATHNTRMQMQNEKKDFVQSQLKRNRDKQSPNKLELSNNNKKQKNKMQTSTQTTLQEYWLGNPASSNRFDILDVY
ncbi:uncharacterized protein LOC129250327 [Anastrepha obliqua]|uniref:uncharacterized protein LOC129250327 n=1 Tax=Anastrepha obliqua TaxID=95512 RepID=UPI0024093B0C|nr:uncharacterized protein LOC129250327 [Anastrepha obliqua]